MVSSLSLTTVQVISSKTQESDYYSVAQTVYQQVSEYNKSLIEPLQKNTW